jgi:hypothetical protein
LAGIVIAVAVVIGWLVVGGSLGADSSLRPSRNTPLDILKERLAHDIWALVTYIEAGLPAGGGHPAR